MPQFTDELLTDLFTYHAPRPEDIAGYQAINEAALAFAKAIVASTPPSADQSAAVRLVREARMIANSAIALQGRG